MKQRTIYSPLLLIIITAFSVPPVLATSSEAGEEDLDELLSMDVADLINIDITVASKKAEKISDAPGVISVITAKEIARFGAQTLFDVLGQLPNVYTFGSGVFPDNVVSIRGGTNTTIDNHTLILINGRPSRESRVGGNTNSTIYRSFPLELVERIEMIRGPGSVLYGSNAFSGVINIITKDPNKDAAALQRGSITASYGSFGTRQLSAIYGTSFLEGDLEVVAAGKVLDNDGWDMAFTGVDGIPGSTERESDNHSTYLQVKYGNFTFTGFDGYEIVSSFDSIVVFPAIKSAENSRRFYDISYIQPLWGDWQATLNVTHNVSIDEFESDVANRDYLYELSARGSLWKRVNLLVGGTLDNHDAHIDSNTTDSDTRQSLYTQLDFEATEWLKFVFGVQGNKPRGRDTDFSPRAGLIITPDKQWGVKLLYGEAFRAAYSAERAINLPTAIVGNPDLAPETIKTIDAQIFYHDARHYGALTLYKSTQEDTIARQGPPPLTFVNSGRLDYKGIELEGDIKFSNKWAIRSSLTWQTGEDNTGNDDVGLTPHLLGKIGLSYDSGNGYTVGLFNNYASDAAKLEEFKNGVAVFNPDADAFNWLTANVNIDLKQFTDWQQMRNATFTIYGSNLLDEDVYFPELSRSQLNTIPQRSGRAVFGRLTVKY